MFDSETRMWVRMVVTVLILMVAVMVPLPKWAYVVLVLATIAQAV